MKNIRAFSPTKYHAHSYTKIEEDIYGYDDVFVMTLQFQQEPERNEGMSSAEISQYPLEDILDRFNVYVSDFYKTENQRATPNCQLEFASKRLESIQKLKTIIGKRIYNKVVIENGEEFAELVIE